MGLQEMDFIMSQNGPDFLFRLANPLEKVAHALHMNEVWADAGLIYQDFVKNPPNCGCLQDHLIKKYLKKMAIKMRAENEETDVQSKTGNEIQKRKGKGYDFFGIGYNGNNAVNLNERDAKSFDHHIYVNYTLGTMEGPEQWDYYKNMLLESMPEERAKRNLAKYLYCKINNNSN